MSYICSIKLKTVSNMGTLEFLRENVGKFFMYGGERCRLVGIKFASDSSFLVIETRNGWLAKRGRFVQMWDSKVERALYVTKDRLIPIENVSARQFVEDNAGRYYTFDEDGSKVRVVDYRSDKVIIAYRRGWHGRLDSEDNFTSTTKATRFWYASVRSLKEIPLC